MKDLETLNITNLKGDQIQIKVITTLKSPGEDKTFLIYTFDDTGDDIDIYASIIKETDKGYILDSVTDESEWNLIQKHIETLSRK